MTKRNDRTVAQKPDGEWVQKRNDTDRAATIHKTQNAAVREARKLLEKSGGGELIIKGRDGRIRSKDTIGPGNDPSPPRDTEH